MVAKLRRAWQCELDGGSLPNCASGLRAGLCLLLLAATALFGLAGCASSNTSNSTTTPTPAITFLNPTSGAAGTAVTITGNNFGATQGTSTVTFNGTAATTVTSWSATVIVVPVPAGATTGNVVVTVGGVATNGSPFTVLATPAITSLSPTSGAVGASITITGTNFGATQGTSTVTFNGAAATTVTNWSATSIVVPVPTGATTGNVVVTVGGQPSNGSPFTVVPAITSLNSTSGIVGASIAINGTGFGATQGSSTVTFNGISAGTATSWSASSLGVAVPVGATTGNVVVTVAGRASNGVSFTVTLNSFSISGTVTYAGSQAGVTLIRVMNSCTGCTSSVAGTSIATAPSSTGTAYTIRGLQPNASYIVNARIDILGTGQLNAEQPGGSSSAVTITNVNLTGVNITVADETPASPVTPTNLGVVSGNTGAGALVLYTPPVNAGGVEIDTSYKIYWGPDVNAATGSSKTFTAQGTHQDVYILTGLTNGPTYFKISGLVGTVESATTAIVGPVTIGAASGANTVSGTVTFTVAPTGPLYVGVYNTNTGVPYVEAITNPVSPQAYGVSGVPNGTYQDVAILDQNNDGEIDAGDVQDASNIGNGPTITVSGNLPNNNINLTPNQVAATLIVATSDQDNLNLGGLANNYNLSLGINWGTKRPVAVTLISGPNVPVPFDMAADQNNQIQTPTFVSGAIPAVGDSYQFLVTFSDGTTQTLSASVTAVLNSFVSSLLMNPSPSRNVPTLTWVAPATPPAALPYVYSVGLSNGSSENWNYYGVNGNGIPNTQTSVQFDVDGSASPSATLTTGTAYFWFVTVTDANRNTAVIFASYTP